MRSSKSITIHPVQAFLLKNLVYIVSTVIAVFLIVTVAQSATTIGLNIQTDGNTTLGDATSDTVTFNARVASTVDPSSVNTYDLGTQGLGWRNVYASTSVHVSSGAASSTLSASGNLTLTGHVLPASNNASDLGAFGTAWRDVYVSNSLRVGTSSAASSTLSGGNLSLTGHLLSAAVNSSDVGSLGLAFRNLFASTSLNVSSGGASSTVSASGNILTTGGLLPGSNNAVDVGSMSLGLVWRNLFASNSLHVGSGAASTTLSSSGNLNVTGNLLSASVNSSDVGSLGLAFRNLFASTSLNVSSGAASSTLSASGNLTLSGHVLPASDNASDLGAFGTALRNVYVSSSLRWGGVTGASSTLSENGSITLGGAAETGIFPSVGNRLMLGSTTTPFRSIYASTTLRIGGRAATTTAHIVGGSASGQGTCLVLTGANGTTYYLSVTSTQSAAMPWTALQVSTASCE